MKHTDISQEPATIVRGKQKLLMISSYRRPFGIAQYVEFLETPLRDQSEFDIEIAALPVDLFRAQGPYARAASGKLFAEILEKARKADVVSIQFEPGLLGLTPFRIWQRMRAIIQVSKKVLITYHTVPPMGGAKIELSLQGLKEVIRSLRGNYVFGSLFRTVRRNPQKFRHLVQTRREANNFALMGIPADTIIAEPLSFVDESTRKQLQNPQAARASLDERYGVQGKFVIGCFGFLAPYKGVEVAIDAMRHLPENYSLLIVGGLHPEGIAPRTVKQPYVQKLVAALERSALALSDRVHFCGSLGNAEFNEVMSGCDAVVLPYAEVGQTSSGPAALALDMQRPVYCSRTHCFKELDRFQPGMISFFEIGNHIELAQKLSRRDGETPSRRSAQGSYLSHHNVEKRAQIYMDAARQLSRAVA
jgi:glycosyltransferase involved in cell wall biosynthesis